MADYQPIRHRFIPEPDKEMRDGMLMVRWDYKGHQTFSTNHYLQHDWNQTLMTKINECRHWLQRYFHNEHELLPISEDFNIVTTTSTSLMVLDSMPYFSYTPEELSEDTTRTVGVLMNRYVVNIDYTDMVDRLYLGTQENTKLACILIDRLGL
jgi:hypothetical protein